VRSHKSRDKNWAQTQNGNDYTIQLDNNAKASSVAKTLTKAPRQYRKAQIRYQKNGQSRYTGVYGSYKSKKEAQQAYDKLPSDLKSQANIKKWNSIQQDL
jgi:septal ring-binding cell division protein DamX